MEEYGRSQYNIRKYRDSKKKVSEGIDFENVPAEQYWIQRRIGTKKKKLFVGTGNLQKQTIYYLLSSSN